MQEIEKQNKKVKELETKLKSIRQERNLKQNSVNSLLAKGNKELEDALRRNDFIGAHVAKEMLAAAEKLRKEQDQKDAVINNLIKEIKLKRRKVVDDLIRKKYDCDKENEPKDISKKRKSTFTKDDISKKLKTSNTGRKIVAKNKNPNTENETKKITTKDKTKKTETENKTKEIDTKDNIKKHETKDKTKQLVTKDKSKENKTKDKTKKIESVKISQIALKSRKEEIDFFPISPVKIKKRNITMQELL